jgi:formate dehydrogenase
MPTVVTYCRICEAACGLLADVEGARITGLRPDPDHVVSAGFACAKGTRFLDVHTAADRVDYPLIRQQDGALLRTGWDQALADIGPHMQAIRAAHGPHSIGVYVGNPLAFSYAGTLAELGFSAALGTRNHFSAASLDCSNKFAVAKHMLGYAAAHPVPDLDHARFALLVGTNPAVSQSSFVHAPRMIERLKAIEQRGGSVYIVDPRRTETARQVGTHVPIRPDTDAAFLLALLHVLFEESLVDARALRLYAEDTARLRDAVRPFAPKSVASCTGIDAPTTRAIARAFAAADGAFCHLSTGVNQGTFGTIAYAAKIALEVVTGNFDRRGGALMPQGALDVARLVQYMGVDADGGEPSRIGGFAPVLGSLPTAIMADEILTPGEGQIRGMVVIGGNPLLSAPDGSRLRKAFEQLDLLVSIDLFVNDTGAYATHVLPSADWLERSDLPLAQLQLQPVPYVQHCEAVTPPLHQRREDWQILADLARAAGLPLWGRRSVDAVVRTGVRLGGPRALVLPLLSRALGPRPGRLLEEHPHGVLVERERPGDFLARRIRTPSHRVELYPAPVWARLPELQARVAAGAPTSASLRLFTKREKNGHNSWLHSNPALALRPQHAFVHPDDAIRLGLCEGDRVRLHSETGSIELPLAISTDIVPGAVAVSHGYGHHPQSGWEHAKARGGANVNLLAPSGPHAVDPLSGMCRFVGIELRLERVATVARAAE